MTEPLTSSSSVPVRASGAQEWTALDGSLTIRFLQYINHKRAERWHGLNSWSALEWAGAMAGEAGEACNAAKKLKRIEDGIANINLEEGRSLTDVQNASAKIVDEIADTVIYGVLLASRVGMDLEEAIRMKFNRKSEEYGFPERIPPNQAPDAAAVRASGEPQTFDPTSLDPMDPRPFNMTLEDLRELVRTEAGRIAYVNDELDRLKALHDGEVQHLKAAAASPSDDGARQPQGGYEADGAWYCERCHGPLSSRKDEIAESWAVLGKSFQDSYGRLPDAIRALGRALKDSEAVNWRDYDLLKKQLRKDIEREQSARASDDGAARPQPAQEGKMSEQMMSGDDLLVRELKEWLDTPQRDGGGIVAAEGLIRRIIPVLSAFGVAKLRAYRRARVFEPSMEGYAAAMATYAAAFGNPDGEIGILTADGEKQPWEMAALSSPSVAQGWTALDGFTLDRIEQTLKTIGAITQDDAHWLIGKLTKAVTPSTPAGADGPNEER